MLCTIESVKRILETQKDNITIGSDNNDNISEANAEQSIREADAIISGALTGVYKFPLRNRILLPKTGISATKSLIYQPESSRQIAIIIRGTGTLTDNNTVVINGTDVNGTALSEGFIFKHVGIQVTANYFKTVNDSGIECGTSIQALTDASITILSYDILNYICQRLASYNLYRDIFASNSPNELPAAVKEWKSEADGILEKIRTKLFLLGSQVAPADVPILARPVYNIPTKFFEFRGVAGIERLTGETTQDYDGNHPDSSEDGTGVSDVTVQTQVIIPPGSWTSGSRPATPYSGQTGFNTETEQFEGWNGTRWIILG